MGVSLSKPREEIRIATKQVKNAEQGIFTKKTMIYLYLCRDNVIEIDKNIYLLQNLRVLQICCNKITKLPKEIGALKNLSILFLSRNDLVEIPEEIASLENLSDLNLSDNSLTRLPRSLGSLKNLKILDISGNPIKDFPVVISRIKSLTCLSILRTQISYLSPSILHLSYLIELNYQTTKQYNMIVKKNETSLLYLVAEHAIKHTKFIKKLLPIGTLKQIASFSECDICGNYIYTPVIIYTSLKIVGNQVPVKYSICHTHDIDPANPYTSIRKSLFIEECIPRRKTENIPKDTQVIDILEVETMIEHYKSNALERI